MLASTPGGEAYTYAELDRMCLEAGFKATDLKPPAPTLQSLVIAQRQPSAPCHPERSEGSGGWYE